MHLKKSKKRSSIYCNFQKRIPEQIIEKAKKAKECPHCGKTQYELISQNLQSLLKKLKSRTPTIPITIRRFSESR